MSTRSIIITVVGIVAGGMVLTCAGSAIFHVLPPEGAGEHRQAEAIASGDFDSYLDTCINSSVSFQTFPIRTIVEDPQG